MTLEIPRLNSEDIDVLLKSGKIPYIGIMTIHDDLWLLDREEHLQDVNMISRGKMAIFYNINSLKSILTLFTVDVDYEIFSKKDLIKLLTHHLLINSRLCRLK